MLREPSKDRPNGLGDHQPEQGLPGRIDQGLKAKLIGVSRIGIGIEIETTGEQYFIEQ